MTNEEPGQDEDGFDASVIPVSLAITGMRDSGYKNTAYALAELIDNSQQSNSTLIEVLCIQKRELINERERARISEIAVIDNGEGMGAHGLRIALQFGNGTRFTRKGIGRFGMGLPNASISQASRVDVWSWQNGPDNAYHNYIDVAAIESGEYRDVPKSTPSPVPEKWRNLSVGLEKSGTIVVWSQLDSHRLTWKSAKATLQNTERLAGRIYRRFLQDGTIRIRLLAKDEGGKTVYERDATFDDPLYLNASPLVPSPFDTVSMFEYAFNDDQEIEYKGQKHVVKVRYSVAKKETVDMAGGIDRGKTAYGQHAAKNIGVSVVRADRELMLDQGWCIGYDPRERWWGAEVEFPPALDEVFGVTNNKQAATHFAELATLDWYQLREGDEEFKDVVDRLKEEGDPRAWLLRLSDSMKRNLQSLRDLIKGQGAGGRSSRPKRHNEPDDLTDTINRSWKDRSEKHPIAGEDKPYTDEELEDVKRDLTENKKYTAEEADGLVSLIKEADLKVVFLEAEFPDRYQLFNVEIKGGGLTEVTFNRRHPGFDSIFGTVNTVDEDVNDLSKQEVLDRLTNAVNAAKVIFAAWARYEREAGVDKAPALEKVRFEWGQLAAKFLRSDDELPL